MANEARRILEDPGDRLHNQREFDNLKSKNIGVTAEELVLDLNSDLTIK